MNVFTLISGNSVLHIAAQNGRSDVIDDLLLKGADVNKVTITIAIATTITT